MLIIWTSCVRFFVFNATSADPTMKRSWRLTALPMRLSAWHLWQGRQQTVLRHIYPCATLFARRRDCLYSSVRVVTSVMMYICCGRTLSYYCASFAHWSFASGQVIMPFTFRIDLSQSVSTVRTRTVHQTTKCLSLHGVRDLDFYIPPAIRLEISFTTLKRCFKSNFYFSI
jgi:hypothetical protein